MLSPAEMVADFACETMRPGEIRPATSTLVEPQVQMSLYPLHNSLCLCC